MSSNYIRCPLCIDNSNTFHKLGIQTHFKFVHKTSWKEYKVENIKKVCENCGNKLSREAQRFCSKKCNWAFSSRQVKEHKNSHSKNTLKKQYLLIDENLKNNIISFYLNNNVTKIDLSKKYNLRIEFIDFLFKEKNIQVKKNSNSIGLINKNKKIQLSMFESDIAKQIVEDYKNIETASFRSLDRKYYSTKHISRDHIRKILEYYNVDIKDANEIRKKVWEEKIARGERHPNFKKNKISNCSNAHWYFYKGIHFQGSYEFKFGLWLESKGIKFLCHEGVKTFEYVSINGKTTCYHPDFYLPETDEYVEIKGYFPDEARSKLEVIKNTYPNLKLSIYTAEILSNLKILDIENVLGLNIENFRYDLKNKEFYIEKLKNKISKDLFLKLHIGEAKSVTKIALDFNESKHLVYILYSLYKIPRVGTEEFKEYKIKYLLEKFGQQIEFDFIVLNLRQKEICKKYQISRYIMPKLILKLNLSSKTVKAAI